MTTYTVFAVYDDETHQPYATTVEAENPQAAMDAAQDAADDANGAHWELVGIQVALGTVEVIA